MAFHGFFGMPTKKSETKQFNNGRTMLLRPRMVHHILLILIPIPIPILITIITTTTTIIIIIIRRVS